MTAPSYEQVTSAVDALRADAGSWVEMADRLAAAAQAAGGLWLGPFHVTGLGHQLGLDEIYRDLQETIVVLLRQGSLNVETLAAALRTAADDCELDEQHALHRMTNIY